MTQLHCSQLLELLKNQSSAQFKTRLLDFLPNDEHTSHNTNQIEQVIALIRSKTFGSLPSSI